MAPAAKLLIGLVAALATGWIWHDPMGRGEAFAAALEAQARAEVARTGLRGIEVRLRRAPLSRSVVLSGPANDFQREGMGSEPGLTEIVAGVKGVGAVWWADQPGSGGFRLPLLAERLALSAAAFVGGLGLAWLLLGRRRRTSFLD